MKIFSECPNLSIDRDNGKKKLGVVIPLDAGWSDIGSWNSIWEISKKDENGNVMQGKYSQRIIPIVISEAIVELYLLWV